MPALIIYRYQRLILLLLTVLFVSACTTTTSTPPYEGEDKVNAVNMDMFLGSWSVRALNPVEGQPETVGQAVFSQDGSIVINTEDTSSGLGLKLRMTGTWIASGEFLQTQLESVEETSGNALGSLIAGMMTSMKERMSGEANVYEMEADRFVVVGKDDHAYEYTRQ